MIEELLQTLGFSEDEARLYLALWESGPMTAGRIAQKHGVARSSLYGVLDRLVQKGIVKWEEGGGSVRRYHAEQPGAIKDIFSKRRQELEVAQNRFNDLLPQLYQKSKSDAAAPRLTVYQGKMQLQNILSDMFTYRDVETLSLWPIKKMVEILGADFFRQHNIARIRHRLFTRAIWPAAHVVDIAKHPYLGSGAGFQREVRIAPPEMDFTMGYWIFGTQVAVLSSMEECFGFVLESREFSNMLRVQHQAVWALSQPLIVPPKAVATWLAQYGDAKEMKQASAKPQR